MTKTKKETKPQETPLFLVWQNKDDEQYFAQYNSLEDAVSSEGDGCIVYRAEPKLLGKFKRVAEVVKMNSKDSK